MPFEWVLVDGLVNGKLLLQAICRPESASVLTCQMKRRVSKHGKSDFVQQEREDDFVFIKQPRLEREEKNSKSLPQISDENSASFMIATGMLRQPLEQLLQDNRLHFIVADMFLPWATNVAAKFGIPRLVFDGTSFFSLSTMVSLQVYEPQKKVLSNSKPFVIPNFPYEIKFTRMKMSQFSDKEGVLNKFLKGTKEAEVRCYGVVVNSFYELKPAYANHYIKVLGRKAWHIGPVSLCNKEAEDRGKRGKESSIDKQECLKWFNTKNNDSFVYICFGNLANLTDSQPMEISMGLEASEQQFIWVVKKGKDEKEEEDLGRAQS